MTTKQTNGIAPNPAMERHLADVLARLDAIAERIEQRNERLDVLEQRIVDHLAARGEA